MVPLLSLTTPLPPTNGARTSTRGHVTPLRSCSMNGLQKERDPGPLARGACSAPSARTRRESWFGRGRVFRRTLVSELRPPAHRPNWLCPGPYLNLLTHSNLLLRPRRPLLPTTRSNLHVLLLRDPTLFPPLPPRPSPLRPLPSLTLVRPLRVAGHRRAAVHHRAAPSSSTPCLHGTHRGRLYAPPLTALALPQRTSNYVDSNV